MCPNLFATSQSHDHSNPPIGFVVEPVVRTHTHKYTIRIKVTASRTHKWNRVIRITDDHKDKTHKYNISSRVGPVLKTHRWDSGGKIKRVYKYHLWDIIAKVTKTKTHIYTVRILVGPKEKTHKYNIIQKITTRKTHIFSSGGIVKPPAIKTHSFNIIVGVTKTRTHKWNILVPKLVITDLKYYKSSNTADSLGGAISATEVTDNTLHNIFDVVSTTETTNGDTEYRCVYLKNTATRTPLPNAKVWMTVDEESIPYGFTNIAIGLGTSAIGGTEQTIADEGTAPTDVTFSTTATAIENALTIGDIPPNSHKAIWIKREILAGSSVYNNNTFSVSFAGDTYSPD